MQNKEEKQPQAPPAEFWVHSKLHPIKFTFLCEFPYPEPGVYAVYKNEQTKLPERVHLPGIAARQLDYKLVFQDCFNSAALSLKMILERMKTEGIEIPQVTEQIFNEAFGIEK